MTYSSDVDLIDEKAFGGCSALKEFRVLPGVRRIGKQAFQDCSSLENITIFYGVKTIEEYAFAYCSSLKTIEIPASVKSQTEQDEPDEKKRGMGMGKDVFWGCKNLASITIPKHFTDKDVKTWSLSRKCQIKRK